VCPAPSGICAEDGVLNGYSMAGWTWAQSDDVNGVFNHYIEAHTSRPTLGPGPDRVTDLSIDPAVHAFFEDGWRATTENEFDTTLQGYLRVWMGTSGPLVGLALERRNEGFADTFSTESYAAGGGDTVGPYFGAWFYRDL